MWLEGALNGETGLARAITRFGELDWGARAGRGGKVRCANKGEGPGLGMREDGKEDRNTESSILGLAWLYGWVCVGGRLSAVVYAPTLTGPTKKSHPFQTNTPGFVRPMGLYSLAGAYCGWWRRKRL
ncbi:hypothetical protein BS50DRAFT_216063 [Corynespora cassiicola Philippines]|uniref:Uncharacterized protein n=1 Tax=Corynespora cassiicola Philippines TaxID=1448308 RepID=A0A2T2N3M8_CORCC|nr:hypothetical protein BS50DRAFT_216063 [Corynespora cassiicola Philippines]